MAAVDPSSSSPSSKPTNGGGIGSFFSSSSRHILLSWQALAIIALVLFSVLLLGLALALARHVRHLKRRLRRSAEVLAPSGAATGASAAAAAAFHHANGGGGGSIVGTTAGTVIVPAGSGDSATSSLLRSSPVHNLSTGGLLPHQQATPLIVSTSNRSARIYRPSEHNHPQYHLNGSPAPLLGSAGGGSGSNTDGEAEGGFPYS